MFDPVLAEAVRARALQPHVFSRLQRHLRDVVDPILAERQSLLDRIAELEAALEKAQAKSKKA